MAILGAGTTDGDTIVWDAATSSWIAKSLAVPADAKVVTASVTNQATAGALSFTNNNTSLGTTNSYHGTLFISGGTFTRIQWGHALANLVTLPTGTQFIAMRNLDVLSLYWTGSPVFTFFCMARA